VHTGRAAFGQLTSTWTPQSLALKCGSHGSPGNMRTSNGGTECSTLTWRDRVHEVHDTDAQNGRRAG
jgi:hypothetical protein